MVRLLKRGGVGVIPTDTIYGVVGSALRPKTVERIYKLRKRNPKKPMIVLISSMIDIRMFGVHLDRRTSNILKKLWPGKVSVILPQIANRKSQIAKHKYLHRGTNALAFRVPAWQPLRAFLKKTGPLVAPSANIEGKPPATTIKEAQKYFGDKIDFYIDAGKITRAPSTLLKIKDGNILIIRKDASKR